MFVIVIAALIGLMTGGVRGMLIAGIMVFVLRALLRNTLARGLGVVQHQFLESTFAVMGALCKADGVVSRNEIRAAEALFARLRLGPEQRQAAIAAFNRGKAPDFDLDAEVAKVRRACHGRSALLQLFLQIQLEAVAADGGVHPQEHAMLVRVARGLGLAEVDVARLEALLRAAHAGGATGGASPQQARRKLDDAYAALGVEPSASDAQIKQAYRRLMSQNHPDKLASKGLPDSMRELAEERSREITTAYNTIKDARGMK